MFSTLIMKENCLYIVLEINSFLVVFVADFSVESKQCFLLLQFLINKMRDKLYFSSIS